LQKAADAAAPTRADWIVNEDAFHAATDSFVVGWVGDELAKGRGASLSGEIFLTLMTAKSAN